MILIVDSICQDRNIIIHSSNALSLLDLVNLLIDQIIVSKIELKRA